MNPQPLAVATNLARTYGSGATAVVAVHGASCTVEPGASIAITGPSGSGKSTLLHLLAGLDHPTAGAVTWPAFDGAALRPGPVSVVFQGPSLLPVLNVAENVALPLLLGGTEPGEATSRAADALDRLDLGFLADKLPEELSGGQAQRAAVARTLAGRPGLILADEPTGQLDHVAGATVVDALLDTVAHLGAGLVLTTHDPLVAERFPVRWAMRDGALTTKEKIMCSL